MNGHRPARLHLSTAAERLRASLFVVPMVGVVLAVGAGVATIAVDSATDTPLRSLPLVAVSTVDSARAVLGTIASATIGFAGVAFSITLLTIQRASTQYSPRVLYTVFRDPYNRRILALVVGTFTYCVVVLRSVRSPLEQGGQAVVPNLSVAVAVVAGIATILAVVAFINHNAHAMDISEILERVRRDAVAHARHAWPPVDGATGGDTGPAQQPEHAGTAPDEPGSPTTVVRFDQSGWVQQVDGEALHTCLPDGHTLRLLTYPGRFAVAGAVLATIAPSSGPGEEGIAEQVRAAVVVGSTRTMQQDVSYGLRQLADVALRALSTGINDPATAEDAIFRLAAVLAELMRLPPPAAARTGPRGTRLLLLAQPTHTELTGLAFDEVRRAAAGHPSVCVALLEALHSVGESLAADGHADRCLPLRAQADLVLAGAEATDLLPADVHAVRRAHAQRFG